jgi:predicted nucleic acid-binding protein
MSAAPLVLDASVGVKWFRDERGSDDARGLLADALEGRAELVAPVHFAHEVLGAVRRDFGPRDVTDAWDVVNASVLLTPLTREVVVEAAGQCEALGCAFYDALSPALAELLGGQLVSADARAHAAYPGVRLLG